MTNYGLVHGYAYSSPKDPVHVPGGMHWRGALQAANDQCIIVIMHRGAVHYHDNTLVVGCLQCAPPVHTTWYMHCLSQNCHDTRKTVR